MHKTVPQREPLEWRFSDKSVSAWGGMRLVSQLLEKIGFRSALRSSPLPVGGSNRASDPAQLMESFLVTVWIGGHRFCDTAAVRFDGVMNEIFGWDAVPSVSTFTRFFGRFSQAHVDEIFGQLNRWFWSQVTPARRTIDLDSTVLTRYGRQQGSQIGYNPHKRGKPSHHPLMAFVADLRMVLHGWMRPGKTTAMSNAENFFLEALEILGPNQPVGLVRADSGFCFENILGLFEKKGLNYVVAARVLRTLRNKICGLANWVELPGEVAVSELIHHAQGWSSPRRVVVVRHQANRGKAEGRLLLDVPAYTYSVYVTNLSLPPAEVWRLYLGRADSENRIRELGEDFGMRGFVVNNFWGTEAAFRSVLLAYNLFALFKQTTLQTAQNKTLGTLRFECIAIGTVLGREGRKKVLRLSVRGPKRDWIRGLFCSIEKVDTPWHLKQQPV
jgi:hypothetical protein